MKHFFDIFGRECIRTRRGDIIRDMTDEEYIDAIVNSEDPRSGGEEYQFFLENKYTDLCARLNECVSGIF